MDFWFSLFDTSDFPARWHCGRWTASHGWLHILSDLGIWSAYFAIPCVLLYFSLRRRDLPFRGIFFLFGAFILLCGTTHLMEAIIFWWPGYRLAGVVKLATAAVSWTTVLALAQVAPRALAMRSPEELQREVGARKKAEQELKRANEELELRVQQRTAELAALNEALQAEREWFRTTLTSIGDAVITTDTQGLVTMLNPVAEALTAWSEHEAKGKALDAVFQITNEETGEPVENPALRALEEGVIVGLANHTVLIGKDGTERLIADSAAPIKDGHGAITGAVLVFRDVTEQSRADQELRYQYDLTKAITDNATTAIFMIDNKSRCTFMNPAAEIMTGFSFEEANGQVLHDLIHHSRPDGTHYPMPECPIDRALPEKFDVRNHEDLFIRKGGEFFPVMCNARPIFREDAAIGTVIEVLDLTQQKQAVEMLQQSEARFAQLADNISQLAWMADERGQIYWYNQRWYDYTGATLEEVRGSGWQKVLHPEHVQRVEERLRHCFDAGEAWEDTFPLRSSNGTYRWFLSRAMPLRDSDGKVERWFGTSTDITEQRETQEELHRLAAKLSEADRRKTEFLATLAHELRNPLAPIRTGLEIMKMTKNHPQQIEQVRDTLERQTQQLITLVDDLLDVSRITRGRLQLRKSHVEVKEVLQTAADTVRPLIDERKQELSVALPDEPIYLDADPHRLAQVFSNLLNNAAKYSPEQSLIQVLVKCQANEVAVTVKDAGIGVPADKVDEIFLMFSQVEHPTGKTYAGLGVGLTLVESLVKMHGGSITVSSDGPNLGSEFTVRLPQAADVSAEQSQVTQTAAAQTSRLKARVLVVDDNQAAVDMLSMMVKMLGNDVCTARDGCEALRAAATFLPDVVLMDIGMPNMNGHEAARRIREQPWGKSMMLVALTGWGQDEDKQRTKEAGFDHHLVKPADPSELQRLLATRK